MSALMVVALSFGAGAIGLALASHAAESRHRWGMADQLETGSVMFGTVGFFLGAIALLGSVFA